MVAKKTARGAGQQAPAVAGKGRAEKSGAGKGPAGKDRTEREEPAGGAAGAGAGKGAAKKGASSKKSAVKKAVAGEAAAAAEAVSKDAAAAKKGAVRKKAVSARTGGTAVVGKVGKKGTGTVTAAKGAVPKARVGAAELAVRAGEDPWTDDEVAEARAELMGEVLRLRGEISSSEASLAGLMRDSGDGAGDDEADTGTKNITREHEMALTANAREMLSQTERALERLDAGTYGLCENCGEPIGKARMQAFPRATLCVACKQKQERRY